MPSRKKFLCQRYEPGDSAFRNALRLGRYLAAPKCTQLPREMFRDDHTITRGWAVGFGEWHFFTAPSQRSRSGGPRGCRRTATGTGCTRLPASCSSATSTTSTSGVLLVDIAGGQVDSHDEELQLRMLKGSSK
jgi:hypothetical protein